MTESFSKIVTVNSSKPAKGKQDVGRGYESKADFLGGVEANALSGAPNRAMRRLIKKARKKGLIS
jgi:hypothetical protein